MPARLALAALCVAALAGCGSSARRPAANPKVLLPPQTVVARRIVAHASRAFQPGTPVSGNFSGHRLFVDHGHGVALGNLSGKEGGAMYPLSTRDGGATWRVAGPPVNLPVANGGSNVAQAGFFSARLWFMCCGLDDVVDVTPDGGEHWWQAFLPGEVLDVLAGSDRHARVIAFVRPYGRSRQRLWVYVSRNGRRWTYDPTLRSVS